MTISFLEIYLERVRDLLRPEHRDLRVFDAPTPVPEATELRVRGAVEVFEILERANAFKVLAPNKIN